MDEVSVERRAYAVEDGQVVSYDNLGGALLFSRDQKNIFVYP